LFVGETTDDGDDGEDVLSEIENILGSSHSDTISGDGFVNTLQGADGDDFLSGRGGDDVLDGGDGSDTADYKAAAAAIEVDLSTGGADNDGDGGEDTFTSIENISGSIYDDVISGDIFDNTLTGFDGDDRLFGGGGDDALIGGDGGDTLLASDGSDTLDGGNNVDTADYSASSGTSISVTLAGATNATVFVAGGDDDIIRNVENITATSGNDTITGDFRANIILGLDGDDVIRGGAGADILDGGDGNDVLRFDELTGFGVSLDLINQASVYTVDGSIDSFSNFESYFTTLSDDIVIGSDAADIVSTLSGEDVFFASAGLDVFDGGNDSDTIDYSGVGGVTSVSVTLAGSIDAVVTVTGGDDDTIRNIENVIGSLGDDSLIGDNQDNNLQGEAGNDYLEGGVGDDKLEGGLGNDILVGGAGIDEIIGGSGNDTADYSAATFNVNVNLAAGEAVLDGYSDSDTLTSIENITGSANNDTLSGNGVANVIAGGDGNDIISGGAGSDTLDGGLGDDDLRFDELTGQGITIDIGATTANYGVDNSTDNFTGFERYFTTNQVDTITGSSGVDTVFALGGNDVFNASDGNDVLDGGADNDTIDYSASGVTSITVTLDSVTPVNVTVTGGDDDSIVNIENVTGSTGNDSITGDEFANTLRGDAGNDVLRGGGGDDDLFGGDGVDTVRFDDLTGTGIVLNIDAGTADYAGDGTTDTLEEFEIYFVSNQDDLITGSSAADTVFALGGNDIFNASAGNDVLDGGGDSDTVDYSSLTGINFITTNLNGSIASTITVDGGDNDSVVNIENIIGSTGDDNIAGDSEDNNLDGFSGDDTIDGAGGDDVVSGGDGDDVLDGGTGNDSVFGNDGDDRIVSNIGNDTFDGGDGLSVNVDLGTILATNEGQGGGVDNLTNIENVIGSSQNDTISGDIQANVLEGRDGDDTLYGAGGEDTLDGGGGVDRVDYTNAGNRVVVDLENNETTDDGDFSRDTLISIENVTGSTYDDDITGSSGVNVINAGEGDDDIRATLNADYTDGGDGDDTIDFSDLDAFGSIDVTLNHTTDAIVDVAAGTNQTIVNVENVIGTSGDDIITGDLNENYLQGRDGDDILSGRSGVDILDGGDGIDTASYAGAIGDVNVNLGSAGVGGASSDGFTTTDTLLNIENVTGSDNNDTIRGDEVANVLLGGAGNDELDGGAGDDTLDGGNDDDILKSSQGDDDFIGGFGVDEVDYSNAAG